MRTTMASVENKQQELLTDSSIQFYQPTAAIETTTPTAISETDTLDEISCRSIESNQNKRYKSTQNESNASCTSNTSILEELSTNGSRSAEFENRLDKAEPYLQSYPGTSNSAHDRNVFTAKFLEKLLIHSEEGKEILHYASKTELSEAKQLVLSSIIAKHHLNTRKKALTEDLRTYALAVTSLFKFERLENYFIPRSGDRKNHGGKIANKIGNLKQRKRKCEAKENAYQASTQTTIDSQSTRDVAAEEAAEWLMLNSEPWSVVLERWRVSYEARKGHLLSRKCITKIFTTYPQYKCQHGFQLIDIDFQKAFPNAKNGLKELLQLVPQVTEYISKKAVDPSAVSLLERLTDDTTNNDKQICTLLLALNTVLPPITAAPHFKPTILVGQEDTLIFVDSKELAQSKIHEIYRSYTELDLPIVPKLVAVGEN
ncbi:uncharacterized protein LOC129773137 [Toxorhynchites rutilus septentrionalis]|uniref:uncharacterized protein LOC129773137 n=1 Tax=Toxorhynchites rutilus septentrionalis TaxID=329112 RepID=UPI002479510F|nr:uncharacterized protein LOC129773137 [Toxorhynchites rutilus septentrionalis]